jgi:hypothetical protein
MCLRVSFKQNMKKNICCILEVTEERSRSGVRPGSISQRVRIRGTESGSAPKCHGFPTLVVTFIFFFSASGTNCQADDVGPEEPGQQHCDDEQGRVGKNPGFFECIPYYFFFVNKG